MDRFYLPFVNFATGLLIRLGWYRLLAWWMSLSVREWLPDGRTIRFVPTRGKPRPIVLVLQADRMSADIRALALGDEIRVVALNEPWLARIVYRHHHEGLGFLRYVQREPDETIQAGRARLREFLREFLPYFYSFVRADCVVRTDIKLQTDFDWCAVSEQLGVRYIVLQRENPFVSGRFTWHFPRVAGICFEGSHIVTYNRFNRQHYIQAGLANESQVSDLGCLRMDLLVERIRRERPTYRRGRITLFAIERAAFVVKGAEFDAVYRDIYFTLAEFAHAHPDVAVVIKVKKQRIKTGQEGEIREMLGQCGWSAAALPNLSFTAEGDAHDHVFASDVVMGMNSSTVMEAAVAGRPVIVPFFASLRLPQYLNLLDFADDLDIFDVPRDRHELRQMLESRLVDNAIDAEVMERRWCMFEKYFRARDGRVRDRVVAKILEIINQDSLVKSYRLRSGGRR